MMCTAFLPFKHSRLESPDPLTAAGVCLTPLEQLLVIKGIYDFNTSKTCPAATISSLGRNVLAACFKHPLSRATHGAAEPGSGCEARAPPTPPASWQCEGNGAILPDPR